MLNDTLDEMELTDIFRTFHPNAKEYNFFSNVHGTFSMIDHILGGQSNLNGFPGEKIIKYGAHRVILYKTINVFKLH